MEAQSQEIPVVLEAVGVFDNPDHLQAALDDLEQNGFMRQELSVLADDETVIRDKGHKYRTHELADHADAPRAVFIPKEIIGEIEGTLIGIPIYVACGVTCAVVALAGGTLLQVALSAIAASLAAGIIGYAIAQYAQRRYARSISAQLKRGGLVLWVSLRAREMQFKALEILRRHAAHHLHVHEVPLYGDRPPN